jgi:hypothetical protein
MLSILVEDIDTTGYPTDEVKIRSSLLFVNKIGATIGDCCGQATKEEGGEIHASMYCKYYLACIAGIC